jgi:hypothetical protein
MKNIILMTVALLLCLMTDTNAQLTGITRAPLQLGNIWVYDNGTSLSRTTIVDSNIVIDSITYFKLWYEVNYGGIEGDWYARLNADGFYALRMDSTYTEPNHELPYYKKDAVIGDTWTVQTYFTYSIEDTFVTNVFGEPTTVKYLKMDGGLILRHEYWTERFGKLSSSDFGGLLTSLQGCVKDGIVYGDTSFNFVDVETELRQTNNFTLEQNYPNPFNPVTKIKYSIPESSYVTLKVYDILGNEIEMLVNDEKSSGRYEVEFDAKDLPSGNYFYRITAGNLSKTKKMLLIK